MINPRVDIDITKLTNGSNKNIDLICDYCGAEYKIKYKDRVKSISVVNKDSCIKCRYIKRGDIEFVKHGVRNSSQRERTKDKIKESKKYINKAKMLEKMEQTNLERYGVKNVINNPEIKLKHAKRLSELDKTAQLEKRKRTNKEKYNVDFPLQNKEILDKTKATNLKKYGVENVFANHIIKEKLRKTNIDKFGTEFPTQSKEILDKIKQTNLNKYGVDNVLKLDVVKDKIQQTNLNKYGYTIATKSQIVKDKILKTMIKNGYAKDLSGQTMREVSKENKLAYSTFTRDVRLHGLEFALAREQNYTNIEAIIKDILDRNGLSYESHGRINNRIYDFLLPEHKLIIECDGLFWHSDYNLKDKNYHAEKRQNYIDAGYFPLFFREDEILRKQSIIESMILNKVEKSIKVYARDCEIREVDDYTAKSFCNYNHLMEKGSGSGYSLFYKDMPIAMMVIKNRGNKTYEISRFCSKLGYTVTGGFSRLIKRFESVQPRKLFTFVDLRYGLGTYLTNLGFKHENTDLSFKWTNSRTSIHRMHFPSNNGYEEGWNKIWDCGQAKYIKNY